MHRVSAHAARELDDARAVEVALRGRRRAEMVGLVRFAHVLLAAVGIGINSDHGPAEPPRRARDAADDLAAVGDQETLRGVCGHGERRALHSENAEARRGARLLAVQRKREPERATGVERIDHAVVPKPRRRVIGMTLPLELLTDRRLDLLLFGLAQAPARALQRIAL